MAEFNGPNKLITLDAPVNGVLDVDVELDLYSKWKIWVRGIHALDTETGLNTEMILCDDHGLTTGQRIVYYNRGGTENIGLVDGQAYFVRRITRENFELYDTKANAEDDAGSPVSTTGRIPLTPSTSGNGETHEFVDDNSKFPLAFRTTGGDPLTPGVQAGSYFFLQNQNGWRIVSFDEDQTINYNGNLVGEDSSIEVINPTPNRTVLHLGLQPVTQRVDEILQQTQDAAYAGVVEIDKTSNNSGTEFPVGTRTTPVNNIADAETIAERLGIRTFEFRGTIFLDRDLTDWTFIGVGSSGSDEVQLNGYSVHNSVFRGCRLTGALSGQIEAIECALDIPIGLEGEFRRCGLQSTITLQSGAPIVFDSCFSEVPGAGAPILNCAGSPSIHLRNYSGGIEIRGCTAGTTVSADLDPGSISVPDGQGNTGGIVSIRGVGTKSIGTNIGTAIINRLFDVTQSGYGESVVIDETSSYSGTVYPIGTNVAPVNNLADAETIALEHGIHTFEFRGNLSIDRDVPNSTFIRIGNSGSDHIEPNGYNLANSLFKGVEIHGKIVGEIECIECALLDFECDSGVFRRCGFDNTVTLTDGVVTIFDSCFSEVTGTGAPVVNCGVSSTVHFRNYSGGLEIRGCTAGTNITIDLDPGTVIVSDGQGNTGGTVSVRGLGTKNIGTSIGTTVIDRLFDINEANIAFSSLIGNVDISGDDQTISILDKNLANLRDLSVSSDGRTRRIL